MLKSFIVMLIGLVMAAVTIKDTIDDRAFERRGKTAEAEPLEKYVQITTTKKNYPTTVSYKADVQFRTESGQLVSVNKKLPVETLQQFAAGRPVTIRYLPDDPRNTRWGDEQGKLGGAGGIAFWIAVMLGGVWWFRRHLNAPPKMR